MRAYWLATGAFIFWAIQSKLSFAGTVKCEEQYKADFQSKHVALNISPSEADIIVRDIAARSGINADDIVVLACPSIENAQADYSSGTSSVLQGEYILYNPTWVANVAGSDRTELYAIFGHELGHIANRHFFKPSLSRREKELEADKFSGCVISTSGGQWEKLEALLTRLRPESETEYPARKDAIEAARKGWNDCTFRGGGGSRRRLVYLLVSRLDWPSIRQ